MGIWLRGDGMVGLGCGLVDLKGEGRWGRWLLLRCAVLHIHTPVYLSLLIWDYLMLVQANEKERILQCAILLL
jgi:hypothetical protein